MKKYIIGFVFGAVLMISGSVFAQGWMVAVSTPIPLTPEEEVALGHTYSVYDGHKLEVKPVTLTAEEQRFEAIEARLTVLEARK